MITATNDISKETGKTAPARESARAEPAAGSSGSGSFMGVSRAETANLLSALSLAQGKLPVVGLDPDEKKKKKKEMPKAQ